MALPLAEEGIEQMFYYYSMVGVVCVGNGTDCKGIDNCCSVARHERVRLFMPPRFGFARCRQQLTIPKRQTPEVHDYAFGDEFVGLFDVIKGDQRQFDVEAQNGGLSLCRIVIGKA